METATRRIPVSRVLISHSIGYRKRVQSRMFANARNTHGWAYIVPESTGAESEIAVLAPTETPLGTEMQNPGAPSGALIDGTILVFIFRMSRPGVGVAVLEASMNITKCKRR